MNDKELIRRALLGDQEAQKECTEKRIVLPCPCCGRTMKKVSNGFVHDNIKCILNLKYFKFTDTELISLWNTRPAPPVGKCCDCKFYTYYTECCNINNTKMFLGDFCSYFKPREE